MREIMPSDLVTFATEQHMMDCSVEEVINLWRSTPPKNNAERIIVELAL